VPFRGNLKDFELVADVLAMFPEKFELFEHMSDEFAQPSDHVNDEILKTEKDPVKTEKKEGFDVKSITLNFSDDPSDA
jgi:hypothetical protein